MLTYVVTLRHGYRCSVRATEIRFGGGGIELWACPKSAFDSPAAQMVALFNQSDVESIVAREFLESEEPPAKKPDVSHFIIDDDDDYDARRNHPIPF